MSAKTQLGIFISTTFSIIIILTGNFVYVHAQDGPLITATGKGDLSTEPHCSGGPIDTVSFTILKNGEGSFGVGLGNPRNLDGGNASKVSLQQGHYKIIGIYTGDGACKDPGKAITFSGDCGSNVKIFASIVGQPDAFWTGFANCDSSISFIDSCIVGNDKDNDLTGSRENDCINGRKGNDRIVGLTGNDKLLGGEGKDSLVGADGNDELTGGLGPDSIACGAGNDKITDFKPSEGDKKSDDCEQF
ncbi:MAG TPA: calcium-binding protein [Nitrososphaeraceae archaeon]